MGKRNNSSLNRLHSSPLPLVLSSEVYGPLPTLFPHNPVSWVYYIYKVVDVNVWRRVPQAELPKISVLLHEGTFKVSDEKDMLLLWRKGFFGKGSLSRSDPTWKTRVSRRLNLDGSQGTATNEDITKKRREERKKFKAERAKLQELELKQRQNNLSSEDSRQLEELTQLLNSLKIAGLSMEDHKPAQFDYNSLRKEDQVLVDAETRDLVKDLEFLQLQAVETFFLKFGLNVIDVKRGEHSMTIEDVFFECCLTKSPKPDNKFILDYVVYHHFRSLGWCVRAGIKFGCDMLLYKRGPPFLHAEYGIVVVPNDPQSDPKSWVDMQAISRVVGGVKKTLMLVYVDVPDETSFGGVLVAREQKKRYVELLKLYKVTEVLHRRWVPSKTRD